MKRKETWEKELWEKGGASETSRTQYFNMSTMARCLYLIWPLFCSFCNHLPHTCCVSVFPNHNFSNNIYNNSLRLSAPTPTTKLVALDIFHSSVPFGYVPTVRFHINIPKTETQIFMFQTSSDHTFIVSGSMSPVQQSRECSTLVCPTVRARPDCQFFQAELEVLF